MTPAKFFTVATVAAGNFALFLMDIAGSILAAFGCFAAIAALLGGLS